MSKVEIEMLPWIGDRQAYAGETPRSLLVGDVILIDGEPVIPSRDVLVTLDGFAEVRIKNPSEEMYERYTIDQVLWGTTRELLILPVTELVITHREQPPA